MAAIAKDEAYKVFCDKSQSKKSGKYIDQAHIILKYILKNGPSEINSIIAELKETECGFPPTHLNKIPSRLLKDNVLVKCGKHKPFKWDINLNTSSYFISNKISGKAKLLLDKSRESALLAIEIFNKPSLTFKTEAFITLMINAWTKLLLSYLVYKGKDYQYKPKKDNVKLGNTYDLSKSIKEVEKLISFEKGVKENLQICKDYRDLVEHDVFRYDLPYNDLVEFFQALILNYEEFISNHFGDEFNINTSLAIALQLTKVNNVQRVHLHKQYKEFIKMEGLNKVLKQLDNIDDETSNSERFRVKLVPKSIEISNTNRCDTQVQFESSDKNSDQIIAVINKPIPMEAFGADYVIPSVCLEEVNKKLSGLKQASLGRTCHYLTCINKAFMINGSEQDKRITVKDLCKPDIPRGDSSRVQHRYHKSRYPEFILEVLKIIEYQYKFLNTLKERNKYSDYKDLSNLSNDYKSWREK